METDDTRLRLPKPVAGELRIHKVYAGPDRWLTIAQRAQLANMSVSAYLNALIDRDELDEKGRPVWAVQPATTQLPMSGLNNAA